MFTELHDGKIYLNNQSMTVLMADRINDYVKAQTDHNVEELTDPGTAHLDAIGIIEAFKTDWRRPRDGSNEDHQDMYTTVSEGVLWAAEREADRRIAALEAQADQAAYRRLLDAVFGDDEDL